jgi:Anti-sigma-28 factor, FlgM.
MTEHTQDAGNALEAPPLAKSACEQVEEERRVAYLNSLKTQIRSGVYRPDIRDLARSLASMLVQRD